MLLLEAVTTHLGYLDSWPTYILQHLFVDEPSPVRHAGLKHVTAFFMVTAFPLNWPENFTTLATERPLILYWNKPVSGIVYGKVSHIQETWLNIIICFLRNFLH
jgi:hypothetical protein